MKQQEHQAADDVPNILWIDFGNDRAFPLSVGPEQAQPHINGQSSLASGALWWMNYGKQGDPIFDEWDLTTGARRAYILEFNGRFARGSRFAATVCAVDGEHVLHQNAHSLTPLHPAWVVELLQLPGAKVDRCWLDWPSAGSLVNRVALARRDAHALFEARHPHE